MTKLKNKKSVLILALSLLMINPISTSFADDENQSQEQVEEVKDKKNKKDEKPKAIGGVYDEMLVLGDDFVTGMKKVGQNDNNKKIINFEESKGAGLTWVKSQEDITRGFAKGKSKKRAIVFVNGFNEVSNPYKVEDYIAYYTKFYEEYVKKENGKEEDTTIYVANIPPIDEAKYKNKINDKILIWNTQLKAGLPEEIKYIDVNRKMTEDGFKTLPDGYHYTDTSYKKMFDYVLTKVGGETDEQRKTGDEQKKKSGETIKGKNSWGTDEFGYRVFYDEDGKIVKNEFKDIDKATYYFDDSGHYVTGLKEIGDNTFFFNKVGIMKKDGLAKIDDKGHIMLFDKNGWQQKGWQTFNNKKYFFGKDGWALIGWWTLGTTTYYFNDDGTVAVGLTEIEGKTYYFNDDGSIKVGWYDDDKGGKYYFGEGGEMYVGIKRIDNKVYAFGEDGKMIFGWYQGKDGRRFFDEKTGEMKSGEQIINGKRYIFDKNGILQVGWVTDDKGKIFYDEEGNTFTGRTKIGENYYYFDDEGYMLTGWQGKGKNKRYYDPENGIMAIGWTNISGDKYYFDNDGKPLSGTKLLDGKLSFFNNNGKLNFAISLTGIFGIAAIAGVGVFLFKKKKENDKDNNDSSNKKSSVQLNISKKTKDSKNKIKEKMTFMPFSKKYKNKEGK